MLFRFSLSFVVYIIVVSFTLLPARECQVNEDSGSHGDTQTTDFPFNDLPKSELEQLAHFFGFGLNTVTNEKVLFPVDGIVYGPKKRVVFPLIVSHAGHRVKSIFVYDTTSPAVYLSEETLQAIGIPEEQWLPSMNIVVHGDLVNAHPSLKGFRHINIVGQEFFRGLKLFTMVDYWQLKAKIYFQPNAGEELGQTTKARPAAAAADKAEAPKESE